MATIKAYTDLEQSKKLAEILPLESSDGYWDFQIDGYNLIADNLGYYKNDSEIPCWSLAALLNMIPKHIKDYNVLRIDISNNDFAIWYDEIGCGVNDELPDITADNPVDACVAMIEKLNELNLL